MQNLINSKKAWLVAVALLVIVGVGAGIAVAQNKYRKTAAKGPYRVFVTKPVIDLGRKAGTLYREHEMVGTVLNDLHEQGFTLVRTEVLRSYLGSDRWHNRLMLICRQ